MENPYLVRLPQVCRLSRPDIRNGRVYVDKRWIGWEDDSLEELLHRAFVSGAARAVKAYTLESAARMAAPLVSFSPYENNGGEFYIPTPKLRDQE